MASNKLYVGNLDYSVDDRMLGAAFSSFGTVTSANVMIDKSTGKSKGFGFVQMDSIASANLAIQEMNGYIFLGRTLVVNEARPGIQMARGIRLPEAQGSIHELDISLRVELAVEATAKFATPLPFEIIKPVTAFVSPGEASATDLAELFAEISTLYRMVGGSGISFYYENSKERVGIEA